MADVSNIVVLTGAGISAESGLATFRSADGLWEGIKLRRSGLPIIDYRVSADFVC